jgi:CheY-like chemotaxis protein
MPSPPSASARGATRSVLVIDDEPAVLKFSVRVLSRSFDPVVAVTSAEAALALIDTGAFFDVILCDHYLSGISGRELFMRLQNEHPAQASRLVIVSGAALDEGSEEFLEALDQRWLEKPMRPADLLLIATTVAHRDADAA